MSKYAILLAGPVAPTPRLLSQLEGRRVIAADSGMTHAIPLNLKPELWLGDFDSASPALQAAHAHVARKTFPHDKNATDGELAITEALQRGATDIALVGGVGGQFDHVLAHAMLLLALERRGILAMMTSGVEEVYPLTQLLFFNELKPGTRISLLPMTDLKGLTITGVRWPLKDHTVPRGATLTLSNQAAGGRAACGVASGEALVMLYPK